MPNTTGTQTSTKILDPLRIGGPLEPTGQIKSVFALGLDTIAVSRS